MDADRDNLLEKIEKGLARVGIHDPAALADADPAELALELDVPVAEVEAVQVRAREHVRQALAAEGLATLDAPALAPPPRALPDRVVLSDTSSKARVCVGGLTYDGIPIVTARLAEDETALLARAGADAVLLKERAVDAPVRLRGEALGAFPIYKARGIGADGPEESRVRVAQIKERAGEGRDRPGFLGRFLGRK